MTEIPTWLPVVALALERADGRILMQRRPPGKAHGGLWEFPGGKVEAGESPRAALVREVNEELAIRRSTALADARVLRRNGAAARCARDCHPALQCAGMGGRAARARGRGVRLVHPRRDRRAGNAAARLRSCSKGCREGIGAPGRIPEPPTLRLRDSNHPGALSKALGDAYVGAPGAAHIGRRPIRSLVLNPAELRARERRTYASTQHLAITAGCAS